MIDFILIVGLALILTKLVELLTIKVFRRVIKSSDGNE